MSCNPAIGGIAKGHLVREIDALGGVMGEVADSVGIQFRLLNTSRGPAVWSPRAQMDKKLYRFRMREVLEAEPNLRIRQAEVAALAIGEGRRVTGVLLRDGRTVEAGAVIVTTGTFLNGLAHVGEMTYSCGRNGEAPSQLLGDQLRRLGLHDPPEDRHSAAPRWPNRQLVEIRTAARRCRADAVLLYDGAHRPSPDSVPCRVYDGGDGARA
jgi:tRNA uridine 5-carboxymethylaminomethyl modification enzyme